MASGSHSSSGPRPAGAPLAREPGRRPLPWPPWKNQKEMGPASGRLAALWAASLVLALLLGQLSMEQHWYNYPVGGWRLGLYPPWALGLLWALWAGWGYGALLVGLSAAALSWAAGLGGWSFLIAWADPLGLAVFSICLRGFPPDPRFRHLRDAALLTAALFFASVAGGSGAFLVGAAQARPFAAMLELWEGWWLGHFVEGLLLVLPLAALLGPAVHRGKIRTFECPRLASNFRREVAAAAVAGAALVLFYSVWTQAAGHRLVQVIERFVDEEIERRYLLEAYRSAALYHGVVVATLLGLAASGAALALILKRRFSGQLRVEIARRTAAIRQRHLQLAALQAITEAAAKSLDPGQVVARAAEGIARMGEPDLVTIYLRDRLDPEVLKRVSQHGAPSSEACPEVPRKLRAGACLAGHVLQKGSVVVVEKELPEHPLAQATRACWQARKAQAYIGVPVPGSQGALGAIEVLFGHPHAPGEEERRLYRLIGRAVGAALERAEAHELAVRQAKELGGLYELHQDLARADEVEPLLQRTMEAARRLLGANGAAAMAPHHGTGGRNGLKVLALSSDAGMRMPDAGAVLEAEAEGLVTACLREGRSRSSGVRPHEPRETLLAGPWRARIAFVTPLWAGETEAFGALAISFPDGREVGPRETGLAEEIARQAGAALRRVRLLEEGRQQAEEIALFEQIGRSLSERLRVSETLERLVKNVSKLFPADWAGVFAHEPAGGELVMRAHTIPHPDASGVRLPLSHPTHPSLAARCFQEGRTLVSTDMKKDARAERVLVKKFGVGSAVMVPLGPEGERFGVLFTLNRSARAFEPNEIRRLEQIASLASAALERARLHEEVQRRADELALLNYVGNVLVEEPRLELSLERIAEIVRRHFDAASAAFLLLEAGGGALAVYGAAGRHAGALSQARLSLETPGAVSAAFQRQEAVIVKADPSAPPPGQSFNALLPGGRGGRGGVAMPLQAAKGPVGVLVLLDDKARRFEQQDVQRLRAVGRLAAAAAERGELGQAKRRLEAQLQQAQKMESVGALAGGMAHDFNNLLGGILGQAALVRAQLDPDDPRRETIAKIEAAAQRGADLTGKLLAFARTSVIQPKPVDAGKLIRETAELLRGSLPHDIEVRVELDPELPPLMGDRTLLQQVLLNLCVNARDAMPHGGTLTLRAAREGGPAAGALRLEVRDSGQGMNEEVRVRLFEPFFTTKEPGKGTGLGLAVVFGIVRSHKGRVSVESQPGEGSCFSVHLPLSSAASPATPASPPTPSTEDEAAREALSAARNGRALGGSEELLLVDDSHFIRLTNRELLESLGYTVHTAESGVEALALIDEQGIRPQLLILDVMMAGLSGVPLLRELRQRLPEAPVLLISGYSKDSAAREMMQAGARELLAKPFRLEQLDGAIRRALDEAGDSQATSPAMDGAPASRNEHGPPQHENMG